MRYCRPPTGAETAGRPGREFPGAAPRAAARSDRLSPARRALPPRKRGRACRRARRGELTFRTRSVPRSEEHTSELQSLMRISYAVFCLKKKKNNILIHTVKHITNETYNNQINIFTI